MTDEVLYHINFKSYVHCPIGNKHMLLNWHGDGMLSYLSS